MIDDHNGICIQVLIDNEAHAKNYRTLVSWMKRNVNAGEAIPVNLRQSGALWDKNRPLWASHTIYISIIWQKHICRMNVTLQVPEQKDNATEGSEAVGQQNVDDPT